MASAEPQSKIRKAKSECCRIKTREAEFLRVSQNRETKTSFHKRQAKSYKVWEKNQKGNEYAESASGGEQNRKTKKRRRKLKSKTKTAYQNPLLVFAQRRNWMACQNLLGQLVRIERTLAETKKQNQK